MDTNYSPEDLKNWNKQGLIPGLNETSEEFIQRANFCLQLEQKLVEQVGAALPFENGDAASKEILQTASRKTEQLYDIAPQWTPLFFSNYQLAPWHGGCAWIFQLNENTPTAAFLQLRAQFRHQPSYLGLYHREELITHELAHVGRMMYHAPKFEEFLAYRSAPSCFRRWLGPIVQSSQESLFFILLLGVTLMTHLALSSLENNFAYHFGAGLDLLVIGILGLALGRLSWRHWQISRCLNHLTQLYQDRSIAEHLLYRLTDEEIIRFASFSPSQIRAFLQEQLTKSFRWQFLIQNYSIPIN